MCKPYADTEMCTSDDISVSWCRQRQCVCVCTFVCRCVNACVLKKNWNTSNTWAKQVNVCYAGSHSLIIPPILFSFPDAIVQHILPLWHTCGEFTHTVQMSSLSHAIHYLMCCKFHRQLISRYTSASPLPATMFWVLAKWLSVCSSVYRKNSTRT